MSKVEAGRLAFRHEGEWWRAYWSPDQHSMDKALLLDSIRMSVVKGRVREDFMALMKQAFSVVAEEAVGSTPVWKGERPAPKSERSGNA